MTLSSNTRYVPMDLFQSTEGAAEKAPFAHIHPCAGPEDTNCVISYDTRTHAFKPESINHMFLSVGLWPHHLHWLLHDRYCDRPSDCGDDVSKDRLQISPLTWSTAGGVEAGTKGYLGANTNPKNKIVGGRSEPVLGPDDGWAEKTAVDGKAVRVVDPDWLLDGKQGDGHHGNMHPLDVDFWYFNIEENVGRRLKAWKAGVADARR